MYVAALIYVMCLAVLHLWWPKLTGRLFPMWLAVIAFLLIVAGFVFSYGPQIVVGYLGMPRRYHAHAGNWNILTWMLFLGGPLTVAGSILVVCYLWWSLKYGAQR